MGGLERQQPNVHIIDRYRRVTGVLETMFQEMRVRTDGELWRRDGTGTCHRMNKTTAEWKIEGSVRDGLIVLREEKNKATVGKSICCPYHRPGKGCVLGDLKGPACLAHIENPKELRERFGLSADKLTFEINRMLGEILNGVANDRFVDAAVHTIESVTEHVRQFPILHPEEVRKE